MIIHLKIKGESKSFVDLLLYHKKAMINVAFKELGSIQQVGGTCIQGAPSHVKRGNCVT